MVSDAEHDKLVENFQCIHKACFVRWLCEENYKLPNRELNEGYRLASWTAQEIECHGDQGDASEKEIEIDCEANPIFVV